eukprot:5722564-Pleurochrysis_carterae.AAC.1
MSYGGGWLGRGKAVARAISRPELVQVDGVAGPALRVLRGWGPLWRRLVAHLPAVPREAVEGVGFGLVCLLDVLGILAAGVGRGEAFRYRSC